MTKQELTGYPTKVICSVCELVIMTFVTSAWIKKSCSCSAVKLNIVNYEEAHYKLVIWQASDTE